MMRAAQVIKQRVMLEGRGDGEYFFCVANK